MNFLTRKGTYRGLRSTLATHPMLHGRDLVLVLVRESFRSWSYTGPDNICDSQTQPLAHEVR